MEQEKRFAELEQRVEQLEQRLAEKEAAAATTAEIIASRELTTSELRTELDSAYQENRCLRHALYLLSHPDDIQAIHK